MARDELSKDRSENGVKSLMKTYEDDIKLFYENDISIWGCTADKYHWGDVHDG